MQRSHRNYNSQTKIDAGYDSYTCKASTPQLAHTVCTALHVYTVQAPQALPRKFNH